MSGWEVEVDVCEGPIFEDEGADEEDWDGEEVIVVHGVEVLEIGEFDALAHGEHVCCAAEAVDHHPDVAGVEGADFGGGLRILHACLAAADGVDRRLDVGPCSDDGRQDHETKGE